MTTISAILSNYQTLVNAAISTNMVSMYTTTSVTTVPTTPYWTAGYAFADPTAFKASCSGAAAGTCPNS